jgi:hypothetical protein
VEGAVLAEAGLNRAKHPSALLLVLLVALGASAPGAAAREPSTLIQASATFQRLGDFWIDKNPSYGGALEALGPSTSCRLVGGRPDRAVANWYGLGVRITLATYGLIPDDETGCTAPDSIRIAGIRVTGKRWKTSLGLRVGSSLAELRRTYPRAVRGRRDGWPRPNAWWLVTRRAHCCADAPQTVPVLLAEVQQGRVVAFYFNVGAQGE